MAELSCNQMSDHAGSKKHSWMALLTVAALRKDEMDTEPVPRDNPLRTEDTFPSSRGSKRQLVSPEKMTEQEIKFSPLKRILEKYADKFFLKPKPRYDPFRTDNTFPASRGSKKQRISSEKIMTVQEIKLLPLKQLVEKYAEQQWDEMNKRYFYSCKLCKSDSVCDFISQSFGNEQKAYDQIKRHLQSHLEDPDIASKLSFFQNASFTDLKSSWLGSSLISPQKAAGAIKNKFFNEMITHATESPSGVCLVKKSFKVPGINVTPVKRLRNRTIPKKRQKTKPLCFEQGIASANDVSPLPSLNSCCVNEDSTQSNGLCKMCGIPEKNEEKEHFDHSYATRSGVKSSSPPPPSPSSETLPDEKEKYNGLPLIEEKIEYQPHLLIKTPRHPGIYNIVPFEVVNVEEVGQESNEVKLEKHVGCPEILDDSVPPSIKGLENNSNPGCNKKMLRSLKEPKATGSVLECVENKVGIKSCVTSTQKSNYSASGSNAENSENMEIKVALRHIDILKKKKHSRGDLKCKMCNKLFTAVSSLSNHYRSHAHIKEYSCEICQKQFTRRHSLNYHMLIHKNLNRFECADCHKKFRHPSHYKEHLRKHNGDTPYHCEECGHWFKTRNTYKRHVKVQHGKQLKSDNTVIDL